MPLSNQELLPIALDMTSSLPERDRFDRLVRVVVRALGADAAALLRVDGDDLVPVAIHGLSPDLVGRRFARQEHPRLEVICSEEGFISFDADTDLPDPFDGFVEASPETDIHACMGCALRVEGTLVGVLTVDAIDPDAFAGVDDGFLAHLGALAAAALRTSDLISALEETARRRGTVAQALVQDVLEQRGGLLVGESSSMTRLRQQIELVARSEFPVLVTGETGTGKELVVRTLHAQSERSDRPLVYLNCAALPEAVAESELFGHKKGAFTGADAGRPGKFKVADGASLLLDEIGELPLHLQPKLLRALQDGEIQPVGVDEPERVNVRVLAATNRDLEHEVAQGRFRRDLLHRLDVCRIDVPPLRERVEDVPGLLGHFSDRIRRQLGTGPIHFSPDVIAELQGRTWPGNVRELENVTSRAILHAGARVAQGEPIVVTVGDLAPGPLRSHSPDAPPARSLEPARGASLREATQEFQRALIRDAVDRSSGNWSQAARALGMDRSNLHHLAKRLGLR